MASSTQDASLAGISTGSEFGQDGQALEASAQVPTQLEEAPAPNGMPSRPLPGNGGRPSPHGGWTSPHLRTAEHVREEQDGYGGRVREGGDASLRGRAAPSRLAEPAGQLALSGRSVSSDPVDTHPLPRDLKGSLYAIRWATQSQGFRPHSDGLQARIRREAQKHYKNKKIAERMGEGPPESGTKKPAGDQLSNCPLTNARPRGLCEDDPGSPPRFS